jgi:predicted RNase H-like nuclease (RuvC/YqgF family)
MKKSKIAKLIIKVSEMEEIKEIKRLERFIDEVEEESIEKDNEIYELKRQNENLWECLERHHKEIESLKGDCNEN